MQNKTTVIQSHCMTLGQETRWAYSTMPRAHTGHASTGTGWIVQVRDDLLLGCRAEAVLEINTTT